MNKHSPGPWVMSGPLGPKEKIIDTSFWVSADTTLHLYVAPCADGFVFGENEANARLISAAPDLLSACQSALAMLNDPDADTDEANQLETILIAAIKKASE
jgi:hypothetical protein